MQFLTETACGYVLLEKCNSDYKSKGFKICSFYNFKNKSDSLNSCLKIIKGKIPKNLKNFLINNAKRDSVLIINDVRLRNPLIKKIGKSFSKIIVKKLYFRKIREMLSSRILDNVQNNENNKVLFLAQNIYRNKLKINGTKLDKFLSQSIQILDETEKQLSIYGDRLREWYGWHFPELNDLIDNSITMAKCIIRFETRDKIKVSDLSGLLENKLIDELKIMSEISSGCNIFKDDLNSILSLCNQILKLDIFKKMVEKYLRNRMYLVAPNLSSLIGENIGARLISHCGSLLNLSKYPSSKIQLIGAEKALYRALKTRNPTPKYGIIFNAKIVNSSDLKLSGKISRILSSKSALCSRIDALGENKFGGTFGIRNRIYIEKRVKQMSSVKNKLDSLIK
jgi:nucleolar protein 58